MNTQTNNSHTPKNVLFYKNHIEVQGGKSLNGHIQISGAKNSALVLMAASILSEGKTNLLNVPKISDVEIMSDILIAMGINIKFKNNKLEINTESIIKPPKNLFFDLHNALRASFFCIGPVLAKFGKAEIPMPGGCSIGARPIDEHIEALKKLGVKFQFDNNYVIAEVTNPNKKLIGSLVNFECNECYNIYCTKY